MELEHHGICSLICSFSIRRVCPQFTREVKQTFQSRVRLFTINMIKTVPSKIKVIDMIDQALLSTIATLSILFLRVRDCNPQLQATENDFDFPKSEAKCV